MPSLDIHRPGMDDLQFVLFVVALCTSGLSSLDVPEEMRVEIFDRCWALIHTDPPPTEPTKRVIDLRFGTEVTLEAMVETIRSRLTEAGITILTGDHPPSEPTLPSTPAALPLIERLWQLYPPTDPSDCSDEP
ncbi:MAG TPA: hypothetical protein VNK46_04585 [Nitrospiraceae bacterium]|jgi:hypothetical protein|nr:hypothetical protein [Nitrospiraceae bacterium]